MTQIYGVEKLLSCDVRKRFGKHRLFGTSQFGHSNFGQEDIICFPDRYSATGQLRKPVLGPINFSGIYKKKMDYGRPVHFKETYRITKNPRSVPQQANRQKMADAVLAWQGLTDEQKMAYHNLSIGRPMSGYNVYLREYLLSH